MSNYVGDEYLINVGTVKFDTTISTFNREQTEDEYRKTMLSIQSIGQEMPIIMDSGLCIDGRHRIKALKQLGIDYARCIDINPALSVSDKLRVCNKDITSGRDLSKSQLAIQAFEYAEKTGCTKLEAGEVFGVRAKVLTYVSNIKTFLPDAYDDIKLKGETYATGFKTKSLEVVNRYVNVARVENEEVEAATTEVLIDYNEYILTEHGRQLFWELYNESRRPDTVLADHLIKYVNLRYRKKADAV